jgi:hypothetical protein
MNEDYRQHEASQEHQPPEAATSIEVNQAHPIQDKDHQQQEATKHPYVGMTRYEYSSVWIQAGMLLATACAAIIVTFQWKAMQETLDVTRESIALTKQAVRAWIITTTIERMSDFIPNSPTEFRIQLKNIGPSTAFNKTFAISVWICHGPPSLSCASQCPANIPVDLRTGETILGPQAEYFLVISFLTMTLKVLDAIKNGTQTAYLCGTISYKDVFNTPHTLNICNYYIPEFDKFGIYPMGNFET